MERDRVLEEVLFLLPALSRGLGKPWPARVSNLVECDVSVEGPLRWVGGDITSGQAQILILLTNGPRSVGHLAEALGVSSSAATQMVDALNGYGMVERRHSESDRRVVFVDYVPQMKGVAQDIVKSYKGQLGETMSELTNEEARAFLKGLELLAGSLGATKSVEV